MRVRVPSNAFLARFFLGTAGRALILGFLGCTILSCGTFTYFYWRYSHVIDRKLREGPFANTAKIFAAPESVAVGDTTSPTEIAAELRRSGYNESRGNPIGYYQVQINSIEIFPGPESYFDQEAGVIRFSGGRISQIVSLQDNTQRNQYQLEPQLITNVASANREKRRMVHFRDIPPVLVEAVTSAEDKRFFTHVGFDPIGMIRAAWVDLKEGRKDQGASTLSMQLAREFFLDKEKRWTRKMAEMIITLQLEQKLSKQEIFEDYCNQIYLGSRGTFRIHGFGEAAEAFLGKDLSQINLPEAAELASLPRWPAYFDPFRHPDHLHDRRNAVLALMRQNGDISDRDYAVAIQAPLTVAKGSAQSVEAPYFVDMVNDMLQNKFQDADFQSNAFRVYSSLDMRLQRVATEAVRLGMQNVDEQIRKQRRFKGQTPPEPQVALIALDPHTGEIKALVGGRSYGVSQLDHIQRQRQPGSIFKPFVYAAAMNTAVEGGPHILTPSSVVLDQPTTFYFDGNPYEPHNFDKKYFGEVTLRDALAHSLNVATVKVAETVGYQAVVDMANRAGMNYKIHPTPAVALGAYDITPLEAAGAYTMFANQGDYVKPTFVQLVRSDKGQTMYKNTVAHKQVLDPRVAYLMTNMMEEVLRSGTGAGVRPRYKFYVPAAGKTGTSRDGWFAGYTTELLCVVWVGFDDSRDLDLEGAHSAAPIWGEFMSRALEFREYRDAKAFRAPEGIVSIEIDPESGYPATPSCPTRRTEVYIAGTEPVGACPLHGGGRPGITTVTGWDTTSTTPPVAPSRSPADNSLRITGSQTDPSSASDMARRAARQDGPDPASPGQAPAANGAQPPKKTEKKGLFRRLIGVFK
jgi:penicillin-binding protein 1B